MECSKYAYYISEYIDGRLDSAMKQNIEAHLKECEHCQALRKDLVGLKDLMHIKSYERPDSEYFEHLGSKIKQRIIAEDVVSIRESALAFFTQPSWTMVAGLVVVLTVSVTLNIMNYRDRLIVAQNDQPVSSYVAMQDLGGGESSQLIAQRDVSEADDDNLIYNHGQYGNLVHAASMRNDQRNVYMLNSISVRDLNDSQQRTRIYQ